MMANGGLAMLQANFGKAVQRLAVPGTNKDGSQSIEIDFADGSKIRVREPSIGLAWQAVWRRRFFAPEIVASTDIKEG
jgi:CxxC motif-containing protein (DUF1111 family)